MKLPDTPIENKIKWEDLTLTTSRLKVYGGWIVTRKIIQGHSWGTGASDAVALGMVFIPDPKHKWKKEE